MTTATLVSGNRTMDTEMVRPRRSLEELVDQLMAALFNAPETKTETAAAAAEPSATRSIHEARRLRQAGDVDTALAVLGSVDVGRATPRETRWAFSEWKQLVKRRFAAPGRSWSTARVRAGLRRWCPRATAGRWRSSRSWGCAGSRARSSRGAASGGSGP